MKVKCTNNNGILYDDELTTGKEYEVHKESEDTYLILNDEGDLKWFYKYRFERTDEKIRFEDIQKNPIEGIEINFINKKAFLDEIIKNEDIIYVNEYRELKPSEIPKLIEWLQKVNTYIEQVKNKTKEMTIEEIEKELGYKIKIVGVER